MSETLRSEIEVALVRKKSRLITSRSIQPLKILNPACETAAHAVLSGYGGGLVAGDKVELDIQLKEASKLLLTTQSNNRVFKSENGKAAEQTIGGRLEKDALAVYFPDPLIPHAKSQIRQLQDWDLATGATLLTVDWFASGRAESGEQFSFSEYYSQVNIRKENKPFLIDKQAYLPEGCNPRSKGTFSKFNHFVVGFLAGEESSEAFQSLKSFFQTLESPAGSGGENFVKGQQDFLFAADHVKPGLLAFRVMGVRRLDLEPFIRKLAKALEHEPLLGFDFYKRRF